MREEEPVKLTLEAMLDFLEGWMKVKTGIKGVSGIGHTMSKDPEWRCAHGMV